MTNLRKNGSDPAVKKKFLWNTGATDAKYLQVSHLIFTVYKMRLILTLNHTEYFFIPGGMYLYLVCLRRARNVAYFFIL